MTYQEDLPPPSLKQRLLPAVYALIFSVTLMFSQHYFSWTDGLKSNLFTYIYHPFNQLITSPFALADEVVNAWRKNHVTDEEYAAVVADNHALRAQLQQYGHFQAENRRLRMLMDSVLTVTDPVLIAELESTAIDGFSETVMINKGKTHAVHAHQTVIDPYGLVGQVIEVFDNSASVMLISDARSRVPAYVERTFQRVVILGGTGRGELQMPWQRHDSDIQVGDKLISSGLGGVYPRGYPIATVAAIERGQDTSFLTITLEPMAHLSSMLEVLLLDTRTSMQPKQTIPIAVGPPLPSAPFQPAKQQAGGVDDVAN